MDAREALAELVGEVADDEPAPTTEQIIHLANGLPFTGDALAGAALLLRYHLDVAEQRLARIDSGLKF